MDIYDLYVKLMKILGPQNWWPVDWEYHRKNETDYRFEIIIGAILVQRMKWELVEKVLDEIKKNVKLDPREFLKNFKKIEKIIKNRRKLRTIYEICRLFEKFDFNLDKFFNRNKELVKRDLMSIYGIGEETAEVICLYAGNKKFFIIDKYLKEILYCLGVRVDLKKLKKEVESRDYPIEFYKEIHALIDIYAKTYCKNKRCCPIKGKPK